MEASIQCAVMPIFMGGWVLIITKSGIKCDAFAVMYSCDATADMRTTARASLIDVHECQQELLRAAILPSQSLLLEHQTGACRG